jgi:hypothetical protein
VLFVTSTVMTHLLDVAARCRSRSTRSVWWFGRRRRSLRVPIADLSLLPGEDGLAARPAGICTPWMHRYLCRRAPGRSF